MPLFSKVFKSKDGSIEKPIIKGVAEYANGQVFSPARPTFTSTWTSREVVPEEVEELIHYCTMELKSRAEALETPFLLLPFRPDTDVSSARTFIANYFRSNREKLPHYAGTSLRKEVTLSEPAVLCSILKWCWSRIPGGVVSWSTYEMFRMGEQDSNMAKNAFSAFIPISTKSETSKNIIYDFFDLLAAIAAHGRKNGLGGQSLSRLAAWWAFEHSDDGKGFEGGYRSWSVAADASSHLFFAYLRSLEPDSLIGFTGINALPRSLQALVAQTEYPPEAPLLRNRTTPKVVMLVDSVSPGPFALLRRAKHFEYRELDLRAFSSCEDSVDALTEECKRVLTCIATANQSIAQNAQSMMNLKLDPRGTKGNESWARFQDFGFTDLTSNGAVASSVRERMYSNGLSYDLSPRPVNGGRPLTPSWADFLNSGFGEGSEDYQASTAIRLPIERFQLPLIHQTPQSSRPEQGLEPGELASITHFELDGTFWWVWITSLASEEPARRKATFGRCALIETTILDGCWIVIEEKLRGASPEAEDGAYIAEKKSRFGFSRRGMSFRKRSGLSAKSPEPVETHTRITPVTPSKGSISPDQQARIKATAATLTQPKGNSPDYFGQRRGRFDDEASTKTNSVFTLGLDSEAGPAMKWANAFDREATRKRYLGDLNTGAFVSSDMLVPERSPMRPIRNMPTLDTTVSQLPPQAKNNGERAVPSAPQEHSIVVKEDSPMARESDIQIKDVNPASNGSITTESSDRPILGPSRPSTLGPMLGPATVPVSDPYTPTKAGRASVASVPSSPAVAESPSSRTSNEFPALLARSAVIPSATNEPPLSPRIVNVERKPVPKTAPRLKSLQDHPAFRARQEDIAKINGATPAEIAAKQAWDAKSRQFEPDTLPFETNKLRQQTGTNGFKKFFNSPKDDTKRRPYQQSFSTTNLQPPSGSSLARRISQLGRKTPSQNLQSQSLMSIPSPAPAQVAEQSKISRTTPEKSSVSRTTISELLDRPQTKSIGLEHGSVTEVPSAGPRQSLYARNVAKQEGPAVSQDSDDYMNAPKHAPGAYPETPAEAYDTPVETDKADDTASEHSQEVLQPATSYDRWAQIRKNAAERAARIYDEEHSGRATRSVITERTEDGETSGEETIESRVARIKARVAELTANVNYGPPPGDY